MKTLTHSPCAALVLSAALLLPAACGDDAEAREARREMNEAIDAVKDYTEKEIQDMTTQMKNRWNDLKTDLEKLKAKAKTHGAETKARVQKAIADIEQKMNAASNKLDSVAEASKDEASESLNQLEKSYESARSAVREAWKELRKDG